LLESRSLARSGKTLFFPAWFFARCINSYLFIYLQNNQAQYGIQQ
jgi:hypothetical protein